MPLTLALAERVVAAAKHTTVSHSFPPVNIVVADLAAHPVAFARMDGPLLGTIDVAHRKARTAALFQTDSAVLGQVAQPGAISYTLEHSNGGLIGFGGGVVLRDAAGLAIGAIGISGASVEEDEIIARVAATAVLE